MGPPGPEQGRERGGATYLPPTQSNTTAPGSHHGVPSPHWPPGSAVVQSLWNSGPHAGSLANSSTDTLPSPACQHVPGLRLHSVPCEGSQSGRGRWVTAAGAQCPGGRVSCGPPRVLTRPKWSCDHTHRPWLCPRHPPPAQKPACQVSWLWAAPGPPCSGDGRGAICTCSKCVSTGLRNQNPRISKN